MKDRKYIAGSRKSEVGRQKSEVGRQKSEVGRQKSEVGRQKSEGTGYWSLVIGHRSEVIGQRSLVKGRWSESTVTGHWSAVIQVGMTRSDGVADTVNVELAANPDGARSSVRVEALPGSQKLEVGSRKKEAPGPKLLNKIKNITTISLTPLLWRGRERLLSKYNQCSIFLSPSPFGEGRGEAFTLLPRGSAGSGDCPGAAAITTIISFLFSSPRGTSSERESEFPTPTSPNAGVRNSGSRRAVRPAHSLPVINQSTLHRGFVPLSRGTGFALANQGVRETIPSTWIKGTSKPERRYVTN